jgi:hypothetical protein
MLNNKIKKNFKKWQNKERKKSGKNKNKIKREAGELKPQVFYCII